MWTWGELAMLQWECKRKELSSYFQSKLFELKVKLWGKLESLCHNNGMERRKEVATGWELPGLGWDRDTGLVARWSWEEDTGLVRKEQSPWAGTRPRQSQGSQAILGSYLHSSPTCSLSGNPIRPATCTQNLTSSSHLHSYHPVPSHQHLSLFITDLSLGPMLLSLLPSIYFQHSNWSCIQCKSDHVTPLLRFSNDPIPCSIKATP